MVRHAGRLRSDGARPDQDGGQGSPVGDGEASGWSGNTWTHTWSAPASRCSGIGAAIADSSPHAAVSSGVTRYGCEPAARVRRGEQIAADVGDPQGAVPERLKLGRVVARLGGIAVAEVRGPDAGGAERRRHERRSHRGVRRTRSSGATSTSRAPRSDFAPAHAAAADAGGIRPRGRLGLRDREGRCSHLHGPGQRRSARPHVRRRRGRRR